MVSALVESLPYIKQFAGEVVVVKIGGSTLVDCEEKHRILQDICFMRAVGIKTVVVHGGGKEVDAMLAQLGRSTRFIEGFRQTPPEDVDVIEMVFSAKINKDLVSRLCMAGGMAVGLSGKDAGLIEVEKRTSPSGEDLGNVGRIINVNPRLLFHLLDGGFIPVISSISSFYDGETANINADECAYAIAAELSALKLIFITDVDGLKIKDKLIDEADLKEAEKFIVGGDVVGGMLPKLEFAIEAIKRGVRDVHMINGITEHSVLTELFTRKGIGTKFTYSRRHSE